MSFDGPAYVHHVAKRLVLEFDAASQAGTSGLIGAAREHPARVQLERLLPGGVGVGSGLIVDSFGSVSRQEDAVIFERDVCPVFTINDTPEATFYPTEGVIAVGEVKSALDKNTLEDAFKKIVSAKALLRRAEPENSMGLGPVVNYRKYGARGGYAAVAEDQFSQTTKSLDQIFGFILCGRFNLKPETIMSHAAELWAKVPRWQAPSIIVSLADGFIVTHASGSNSITRSAMEADGIMLCLDPLQGFPELIALLGIQVMHGRSVDSRHFARYLRAMNGQSVGLEIAARLPVNWKP